MEKATLAQSKGGSAGARALFARAVSVTHQMAHALVESLRQRGTSFLVAPFEADAQLAFLSRQGLVDFVITEDSDALVFGCQRTLFKLDPDGNGMEIQLRNLGANSDLSFVNWSPDMFLDMCLLCGCDYLASIPGLGIKTAHRLVKEHRTPKRLLDALRSSKFELPEGFEPDFWRARAAFRHQRVIDPRTLQDVPMTAVPTLTAARFQQEGLDFLGPPLPLNMAERVAHGLVHPKTYVPWQQPPSSRPPVHATFTAFRRRGSEDGDDSGTKYISTQLEVHEPAFLGAKASHWAPLGLSALPASEYFRSPFISDAIETLHGRRGEDRWREGAKRPLDYHLSPAQSPLRAKSRNEVHRGGGGVDIYGEEHSGLENPAPWPGAGKVEFCGGVPRLDGLSNCEQHLLNPGSSPQGEGRWEETWDESWGPCDAAETQTWSPAGSSRDQALKVVDEQKFNQKCASWLVSGPIDYLGWGLGGASSSPPPLHRGTAFDIHGGSSGSALSSYSDGKYEQHGKTLDPPMGRPFFS